MSQIDDEIIVYYTVTVAAHVSLAERRITRIVELREEIHEAASDEPMRQTTSELLPADPAEAVAARVIAERDPWPAYWEFGY
jgi:hypothetical protein